MMSSQRNTIQPDEAAVTLWRVAAQSVLKGNRDSQILAWFDHAIMQSHMRKPWLHFRDTLLANDRDGDTARVRDILMLRIVDTPFWHQLVASGIHDAVMDASDEDCQPMLRVVSAIIWNPDYLRLFVTKRSQLASHSDRRIQETSNTRTTPARSFECRPGERVGETQGRARSTSRQARTGNSNGKRDVD